MQLRATPERLTSGPDQSGPLVSLILGGAILKEISDNITFLQTSTSDTQSAGRPFFARLPAQIPEVNNGEMTREGKRILEKKEGGLSRKHVWGSSKQRWACKKQKDHILYKER
jgi:hypothetical protein